MSVSQFSKHQLPFVLWVLLIFGLSSIQNIPAVKSPISLDKIAHIVMFMILAWLGWRAFYYQDAVGWLRRHALLVAVLFAGIYGGLNEFHQMYLPGRSADVYDAIANFIGAGLFLLWHVGRRRKNRPRRL